MARRNSTRRPAEQLFGRATSTSGGELLILDIVQSGWGTRGNAVITLTGLTTAIFDTSTVTWPAMPSARASIVLGALTRLWEAQIRTSGATASGRSRLRIIPAAPSRQAARFSCNRAEAAEAAADLGMLSLRIPQRRPRTRSNRRPRQHNQSLRNVWRAPRAHCPAFRSTTTPARKC